MIGAKFKKRAALNLPTKFHVSTHYEDMKGDTKYRIWVVWGRKGSVKVTENSAIRSSAYEFLLAFHINYVPVLHRF